MVNENYMKTLNWLAENNINLSQDELGELKSRIETADYNDVVEMSYDEAFDILGDIDYELSNLDESAQYGSYLFESANADMSTRFKKLKTDFKELNKEFKNNIKSKQYVAASKNLDSMSQLLATAEKDIRSIDASTLGDKAGGFFRTFGLQIIGIALAGFIAATEKSKLTGKVTGAVAKPLYKASDKAYAKSTSVNNSKSIKALNKSNKLFSKAKDIEKYGAIKTAAGIGGFSIGTGLLNAITVFKQASADKKAGDTNYGNFYREKLLVLIKEMRKEVSLKSKIVSKLSSMKDNEMLDDEADE